MCHVIRSHVLRSRGTETKIDSRLAIPEHPCSQIIASMEGDDSFRDFIFGSSNVLFEIRDGYWVAGAIELDC